MKLIHCADLHLDSPMESNLSSEQARERKNEILSTFAKVVRLADEGGVAAILISGDLFDSTRVTQKTQKYVRDLIASHPRLCFFYLAGNHDRGKTLQSEDEPLPNLYTFGNGWRSYEFGDVVITGSEQPNEETLSLNKDAFNIVMLHGQDRAGEKKPKDDTLRLRMLRNKHIDYLALGHIHEYRTAKLDDRCLACYSGCLEGRGFDECGKKGYVLLEIENQKLTHTFVPIAKRTLHTVSCDISGITSQLQLENHLLEAVKNIPSSDLVKAILCGSCGDTLSKDVAHLTQVLSERFYFAKITDESKLAIHPEDYRLDVSLKGEFVRRVLASNLSDAQKERVIACGFRVLMGEECGL